MKIFEVISLFPDMFPGTLNYSIFEKSRKKLWDMHVLDMRLFGMGKNKCVDDTVFGGIPGMLIRPDVVASAVAQTNPNAKRIFLSPRGKLLDQNMVENFANNYNDFVILCGRYEGVDQRAVDHFDFEEISIGNYILAGAEVATMVLMEAIIRKVPGVLGNPDSFAHETFANNEISEPKFTKPASWNIDEKTLKVPEVLTSGNHKKISEYRASTRKKITE